MKNIFKKSKAIMPVQEQKKPTTTEKIISSCGIISAVAGTAVTLINLKQALSELDKSFAKEVSEIHESHDEGLTIDDKGLNLSIGINMMGNAPVCYVYTPDDSCNNDNPVAKISIDGDSRISINSCIISSKSDADNTYKPRTIYITDEFLVCDPIRRYELLTNNLIRLIKAFFNKEKIYFKNEGLKFFTDYCYDILLCEESNRQNCVNTLNHEEFIMKN